MANTRSVLICAKSEIVNICNIKKSVAFFILLKMIERQK
ncbi:hypothetical protein M092_1095 [Parabacteroides distasonis str. 3776 D15 iv]|nr:hypothetical protein M092_1095 [Parabacteroides distasonis str. 3776 D15 iv]